jgi:hypothetical protein
MTLLGLVSALKGATERTTTRIIRRRKERRRQKELQRLAALNVIGR